MIERCVTPGAVSVKSVGHLVEIHNQTNGVMFLTTSNLNMCAKLD